MLQMVCLCKTG